VIAGKYSVRATLGDGGAVITYHCVSQQGQEVAVKLYDPAVAGHAPVMKALEQAYAATNALPQNSSAPIIDAGYDQATVAPFSVTELLRLPSLGASQRRFTPEEVVTLLKGLARSLDLAHLRQVVHGALKPTNVFIGPNLNPVVVTDFAANLPKAAVPTAEGYALSAPWIAPEQAQSGQVTPAADVFSTALVAFFALTGRSYWRSCQGPQLDLAGWQQELAGPRSPASSRAAEMGVPLSPALDMVLFKALSAGANERYRSIGEFATTLEDALRAGGAGRAQQQAIGGGATMALPMVGDAPSPLPPHMQKPLPAAGRPMMQEAAMGTGAATMALPLSALLPGGVPPNAMGVPPGPPPPAAGMPPAGYGQPGVDGGFDPRLSGQSMPQPHDPMNPPYANANAGGWAPGAGAPGAQQPYGGQYGDPGYPPPPAVGMQAATPVQPLRANSKSKAVPIVIALTAVALLAGVAAIVVVKVKNAPAADTSPIALTSSPPKNEPTPAPTPTPKATEETSSAPPPSALPSASSAPVEDDADVRVSCTPACDAVVIDGKPASATDPTKLTAGKHTVQVSKRGYLTQTSAIEVKAGEPLEKEFTLVAAPAVPVPVPRPCRRNGFLCDPPGCKCK
jgi:serine/threonine protein kinase